MMGDVKLEQTIRFVEMFDRFFDCLNVNSYNTGRLKRKVFKQPYRSGTDYRLKVCYSYLICTCIVAEGRIYSLFG